MSAYNSHVFRARSGSSYGIAREAVEFELRSVGEALDKIFICARARGHEIH